MSHRRQTVTRRTRCTPAPSREGAFGLVQVVSAGDKEASAKQKRESAFPHERVRLDIQLQPAQASVKADRKAILNAIVGADADVEPPDEL